MNRQQVTILGARVDRVSMSQTVGFVAEAIKEGKAAPKQPKHIITLNAEIIYRAQQEPELLQLINQADLVTPDGAGVVWAANHLGQPVPERVTGIDLLQNLIEQAAIQGWKLFFFGGAPGVAEEAAANIEKKYPPAEKKLPKIETNHGFISSNLEEEELIAKINAAKPDILAVALGAPKQEYWIKKHRAKLNVPVCIGVGGSLDVLAGRAQRAPQWLQDLKLEWLYRLAKEPYRYKRMLALPKFMGLVLKKGRGK